MLKSCEPLYEDVRLQWVREQHASKRTQFFVTVLDHDTEARSAIGTKELPERTKRCVRPVTSLEGIDADVR